MLSYRLRCAGPMLVGSLSWVPVSHAAHVLSGEGESRSGFRLKSLARRYFHETKFS